MLEIPSLKFAHQNILWSCDFYQVLHTVTLILLFNFCGKVKSQKKLSSSSESLHMLVVHTESRSERDLLLDMNTL